MNGHEIAKLRAECLRARVDRALARHGITPKLALPAQYLDEQLRQRQREAWAMHRMIVRPAIGYVKETR